MQTPRSQTDYEDAVVSEPILTEVAGSWRSRREVAHQLSSVLSALSWSQFDRIQIKMSSVHAKTRVASSPFPVGGQRPYTCVSSAYRCILRPWHSISFFKSGVYKINRVGPRTDPCVIPLGRAVTADCWILGGQPASDQRDTTGATVVRGRRNRTIFANAAVLCGGRPCYMLLTGQTVSKPLCLLRRHGGCLIAPTKQWSRSKSEAGMLIVGLTGGYLTVHSQ
jgi:hypothetical protein